MKKRIIVAVAIFAAVITATGCGSAAHSGSAQTPTFLDADLLAESVSEKVVDTLANTPDGSYPITDSSCTNDPDRPHRFFCHLKFGDDTQENLEVLVAKDGQSWMTVN